MICRGCIGCPYYQREIIPTDRGLKVEWYCTKDNCVYEESEEEE